MNGSCAERERLVGGAQANDGKLPTQLLLCRQAMQEQGGTWLLAPEHTPALARLYLQGKGR